MVAAALDEGLENGEDEPVERNATLDEKRRHELKCHEVFLSRQVETLPATHIRGKCSVTLLSEAESPLSYLEHDVSVCCVHSSCGWFLCSFFCVSGAFVLRFNF